MTIAQPQRRLSRVEALRQRLHAKHTATPEEHAARQAAYAERDRQHAALVRANRARERALAKAAEDAQMAAEVAKIRAEVSVRLRPPRGERVAVDTAGMLLLGPLGAIGCGAGLLRTFGVMAGRGRHLVPDLLAAGQWADEAALRAALEAFQPKLLAVGLRVSRRKAGWRLACSCDPGPAIGRT